MDQDWVKRSLNSQTVFTRPQSDTTGYKTVQEDIELPVRRKQVSKENPPEVTTTAVSLSESSDGFKPQSRKITKSFKLATRPFGFNVTITETTHFQEVPRYFAVSSEFNPKQPDIVLYSGGDRNGNQVAIAYYRFSRHIRMGFGSETLTSGDGIWEELRNTSACLGHGRYELEFPVRDEEGDFTWNIDPDAGRTRKKFVWERTRDPVDGVKGIIEQYAGWRNYRLVEHDTGKVLAVMLISMFTGCSYKGVLNLHEALSPEMEQVVIMTATCIFDKGERRIRHYAFGNGGGGP